MSVWRPSTTGILITGVVLIIIAVAVSFIVTHFEPRVEVRLGSGVVKAKLADNEEKRITGLSGVEKLGKNEGLLMVFDTPSTYGIWMKDMLIPIDIVWLDANKKVIYIVKNADPKLGTDKTYAPSTKALYVLEVPAGTTSQYGVKIGDVATFELAGGN